MKILLAFGAAALAALSTPALLPSVQGVRQEPAQPDPAEMLKLFAKYTTVGEEHRLLERFIGEWDAQSSMIMGDQRSTTKGSATFRWKVEGRWLESEWRGEMMGMPVVSHGWLGYDKFKMSYVMTCITSLDTAMNEAEGDLTPDGKALVMYGTLDEYLSGEHDKMVKYVYRFVSADEIVFEVHDLPIGEVNTQVMEFRFTRKKG
jgi:hypothetical protein